MPEDFSPLAGRQDKSKAMESKTVEHRSSALHGASTHKPAAETGTTAARQTTTIKSLGCSAVTGPVTGSSRKESREPERESRQERSAIASHTSSCSVVGLSPHGQPSKPVHSTITSASCQGVTFIGDTLSTTTHSNESGCGLVASGTNKGGPIERGTNSRQWTR